MNYEEIKEAREWNYERKRSAENVETALYILNIEDIVEQRITPKRNDVEVWGDGSINVENKTTKMFVKTLTECSDPSVNYYEDGKDSIWYARLAIEELTQCEVTFIEDVDVGCYDVNYHGYFIIKIGGYENDKELKEKVKKLKIHCWYPDFDTQQEVLSTANRLPKDKRKEFVDTLLQKEDVTPKIIREVFKKMIK